MRLLSDAAREVRMTLDDVPELRDMSPFDRDELAARLAIAAFKRHDCDYPYTLGAWEDE